MASKKAGSRTAIKAAAVALTMGAGSTAVRAAAAAGATRPESGADEGGANAVLQAVAEQMPGWKLAGPVRRTAVIAATDDARHNVETGVSLADLRRKFFGTAATDSADADAVDEQYQAREADVAVFRIEPIGGGPSRVAELRAGKVQVVSG